MTWQFPVIFCFTLWAATSAINKSAYKIILTQKGYSQFLQYDVETPPLREFTFCTWIRFYDLGGDQSIFTYVADGNNRVLRLWLDSGGRFMKVSIYGNVASSAPVEFVKDVWRHVCLSYQSAYGVWALYVDAKLVSCEVRKNFHGFVLPRGGRLIVGYGTGNNGIPSGLEGEIFGVSMILYSTIEMNITINWNDLHDQRLERYKIKVDEKKTKHIIMSDLQTDEIHNNFEKTQVPEVHKTRNFIRLKTPHSYIEHDVGLDLNARKPNRDMSKEKEILDFSSIDAIKTSDKNEMNFWSLVNHAGHEGKFKVVKPRPSGEITESRMRDFDMISEYETPPPPPHSGTGFNHGFYLENIVPNTENTKSVLNANKGLSVFNSNKVQNKVSGILPDVETPPPPVKNTKVYGQWTSSKFAGNVLKYLKGINFYNKQTPSTISLPSNSDNYPYASELKIKKIRPSGHFQRRKFIDYKILKKRGITNEPQINVQIVEEDLRGAVLREHAQTEAKNVKVTNRGEPIKTNERFYRNANHKSSQEYSENNEEIYKAKSSQILNKNNKSKSLADYDLYRDSNLITILPFLKSLEYFVADSQNKGSNNVINYYKKFSHIYSKSLSNENKWHNVESYNNDYTPRGINIDSGEVKSDLDAKIAKASNSHPPIRQKYKNIDDPASLKGRKLAISVSNQSDSNRDSIPFDSPFQEKKIQNTDKVSSLNKGNHKQNGFNGKTNFDKPVKLGNALNEGHVIGLNEEQKKQSFVGGNEKIPDINRYRSDLDNENIQVPSSLGPRVCKNIKENNHVLYVKSDENIDTNQIMSSVKNKNLGIEFILQNYNRCSLEGSIFENSYLLLIDWVKTPVRLFGAVYTTMITDLCAF